MKVYIQKDEQDYVRDLVTYNPKRENYIETEVVYLPANVMCGCFKLENGEWIIDQDKYDTIHAREKVMRELGEDYREESEETQSQIQLRKRGVTLSDQFRAEGLLRRHINSVPLSNNDALSIIYAYPEWTAGEDYEAGEKVQHEGRLFNVNQPVSAQEHQPPGSEGMGAIYTEVNEENEGTKDDPIPYDPVAGMILYAGKFYSQNDVVYECTRDSITALNHNLADLVGHYVIVAE